MRFRDTVPCPAGRRSRITGGLSAICFRQPTFSSSRKMFRFNRYAISMEETRAAIPRPMSALEGL